MAKRRKKGTSDGSSGVRHALRVPGKIYTFSEAHFRLLEELDRLHPNRAPVIDFDAMLPGMESIESVSLKLFERFRSCHEQQVFLVFCRLNAERLLDFIDERLDTGALPLDRDEILAETYARLFRSFLRQDPTLRSIHGEGGIWSLLVRRVEDLITEQAAELRTMHLPLPGLPLPIVATGDAAHELCKQILDQEEVALDEKEVRRWAAFGLMQLDLEHRRAFLLREAHGLEFVEVADRLEITPFEAAQLVRTATDMLASKVRWLVDVFVRSAAAGDSPEPDRERADPDQTRHDDEETPDD